MKGIAFLLILLIVGSLILFYNVQMDKAADSPIIEWTKTYPTQNQSASYVVQTKDGGYAIAGIGYSKVVIAPQREGLIIKTDLAGNLIWTKTYPPTGLTATMSGSIVSFAQTYDEGYALIMSGEQIGSAASFTNLTKTDMAGKMLWSKSIGGGGFGPRSFFCSIVPTSDEGLAQGGNSYVLNGYLRSVFLNKTDLSNNQIWSKTYPNQTANCIIQTSDGGFAIGSSLLIKTDSLGNILWTNSYGNDEISNLLQTNDGGFAFQGNGKLFKTDAFGNLQWMQTCSGKLQVQTTDGGFLSVQDNILFRIDSSGNLQSSQAFGATLNSVVKTGSEECVLAGTYPSASSVNSTVWLTKISLPTYYDWPMFHHDAARSGYSTSTSPMTNQTLWSFAAGGAVSSSPAVVNGVVYVGSADGNIYALDAVGGSKLWSFAAGGAVSSSPAVVNGVVYVGSADGNIYALDAVGGSKLWSFAAGGSSPVVANGVVYVGSKALDASTGNLLWSFTGGGGGTTPTVANDIVYVVLSGGLNGPSLYALNASTGSQLWSIALGPHGGGIVAVANGRVYGELSNGILKAYNATSGVGLWSDPVGNFLGPCPAVANGVVYAGIDSTTNSVFACDAYTGSKLWSYSAGSHVASSPAVGNGVVYVGSDNGNLYALDASTGNKVWSYLTGGAIVSSPAIANGRVYVGSNDGKLYCFGLPVSISLTGASVISGGSGYTTPHVVLVGGGGTGATGTARVSQGVIFGIVLTNPGSGYTSPPTIVFRDPSPRAKGATATINYVNP